MDSRLQDFADKAIKYAVDSGAQYCDARAEDQESKSVLIDNGEIEHVRTTNDAGIGIRLVKQGAWGFCSITNPNSFDKVKDAIDEALRNSSHYTKEEGTLYPNISEKKKDRLSSNRATQS